MISNQKGEIMTINLNARVLQGLIEWQDTDKSGSLTPGDRVRFGKDHMRCVTKHTIKDYYTAANFLSGAYLGNNGLGRVSFLEGLDGQASLVYTDDSHHVQEIRSLTTGQNLFWGEPKNLGNAVNSMAQALPTLRNASCNWYQNENQSEAECDAKFDQSVGEFMGRTLDYEQAVRKYDLSRQSVIEFYKDHPRANYYYDYGLAKAEGDLKDKQFQLESHMQSYRQKLVQD